MEALNGLQIILFKSPKDWEQWLETNRTQSQGAWLKIVKKASGAISVSYAAALDAALCYGWIDGQK